MLEDMYWEEFWETVQLGANTKIEEMNAELRFQFMLHTDKKNKDKWKDLPLPFPAEREEGKLSSESGVEQLPTELQGLVYRPDE